MKKMLFLSVWLLVSFIFSTIQAQDYDKLPPARGHYKNLLMLNPGPKGPEEEIDKQKFPSKSASVEKARNLIRYYLKDISLEEFKIPEPPANSSEQTRAELNYLLRLQEQRTESEVASSLHMAGVYYNINVKPEDSSYNAYRKNLFFIGRSIGTWFNPTDLPLTADLMANVWQDASYFIWNYKYKYLRVRPYVIETDLKNLEDTNWAAYPSGHAANSYINAYIYQKLAPEFSDIFLKDAYDMAHSREIIGVHYPSDSESSRILARQFVDKLFQNDKFLNDFEKVKNEWAKKAKENFSKPDFSSPVSIKQSSSCAKTCQ